VYVHAEHPIDRLEHAFLLYNDEGLVRDRVVVLFGSERGCILRWIAPALVYVSNEFESLGDLALGLSVYPDEVANRRYLLFKSQYAGFYHLHALFLFLMQPQPHISRVVCCGVKKSI
jgi:hypothetical protein